jgi:hypothetical protein
MILFLIAAAFWLGVAACIGGALAFYSWWFGYRPARERARAIAAAWELSTETGGDGSDA